MTNNYLIDILFEAPAYVGRIFGVVLLHLELHHDPEEGWDELFIVIRSLYKAEEAIKLENRLAEEWKTQHYRGATMSFDWKDYE